MVYTVTLNPAVDCVMMINRLKTGEINRSLKEEIYFGGKGINISLVLRELGVKSTALGFVAGFTGTAIEEGIIAQGIATDFVRLSNGFSRINVKIKSGEETEINGPGPEIKPEEISMLFNKLDALSEGDMIFLAGSIPGSLPGNIYEQILERLKGRGVSFAVDAERNLLEQVLKYKPFLVKPNLQELEDIAGCKLKSIDEVIEYARKLRMDGAENVLVSMAERGAVLADGNGDIHVIDAPEGKALNSVGAGDSMAAGFVAGYLEKGDYGYALRLGTAAGSATAFSKGLAKREKILKLMKDI